MQTIWKFPLEVTDEQIIEMPDKSTILSIQTQFGNPCIWALVNPDADKTKRRFFIFGIGHNVEIEEGLIRHIGTFQMQEGRLVFHVFEVMDWEDVL